MAWWACALAPLASLVLALFACVILFGLPAESPGSAVGFDSCKHFVEGDLASLHFACWLQISFALY